MKKTKIFVMAIFMIMLTCFSLSACFDPAEITDDVKNIVIEGFEMPENAKIIFNEVDKESDQGKAVIELISSQKYDKTKDVAVYDISVMNGDVKLQPTGKVRVTIKAPYPEIVDYVVFHLKDSGVAKLSAEYTDGKITFETDSFSYFAVAAKQKEKFNFRAYADNCRLGSIFIGEQSVDEGNGYFSEVEEGTSITLKAQPNRDEYEFLGWYNSPVYSEVPGELISENAQETFVVTEEMTVYARFDFKVSMIYLDGANAGFNTNENGEIIPTIVALGERGPNPENVVVSAIRGSIDEFLERNEYEIDLGGYNNNEIGIYTITYIYKADRNIRASLVIEVQEVKKYNFKVAADKPDMGNVYVNGTVAENGIAQFNDLEEGSRFTVRAMAKDGYKFVGWFDGPIESGETAKLIQSTSETNFTIDKDLTIYARFEKIIKTLCLDATDTRFNVDENGVPMETFIIEATDLPDPESVKVYIYDSENGRVDLSRDEYEIDFGDYYNGRIGSYTIKFIYIADRNLQAEIKVTIEPQTYEFIVYADDATMGSVVQVGQQPADDGNFSDYLPIGAEVKLTAVVKNNDYEFLGWYRNLKTEYQENELISKDIEYTYLTGSEASVYARFDYKVSGLALDGTNAGFVCNEQGIPQERTKITVGERGPLPLNMYVAGIRGDKHVSLEPDEYTIDLNGYDNNKVGVYNIVYSYNKDSSITATIVIEVTEKQYIVEVYPCRERGKGSVYVDGVIVENEVYRNQIFKGTKITLKADVNNGYEFICWSRVQDSEENKIISYSAEFELVVSEDIYIEAIILPAPNNIKLELRGSGFNFDDMGNSILTTVDKGVEAYPDVSKVRVIEERVDMTRVLETNEYSVNLGGYDNAQTAGHFTIVFTHKKYPELKAQIEVDVLAPKYFFSLFNHFQKMGGIYNNNVRIDDNERGYYSGQYDEGQSLTLEARVEPDCQFIGWYTRSEQGETLISNELVYTFVIDGDMDIYTVFKAPEPTGVPLLTIDMTGKKVNPSDEQVATKLDYYIDKYSSDKYQGALIFRVDGKDSFKYGIEGSRDGYTSIMKNVYNSIVPTVDETERYNGGTIECKITYDPQYRMFTRIETGALKEIQGGDGIYNFGEIILAKKVKFDEIWNSLPADAQDINNVISKLEELVMPDYEGSGKEVDQEALYTIHLGLRYYDFTIGGIYASKDSFERVISDKPENGAFGEHSGNLYSYNLTDYDVVHLNAASNPNSGTHALVVHTGNHLMGTEDGAIKLYYSGYNMEIEGGKLSDRQYEYQEKEIVLTPGARYIHKNKDILVNGYYYDYNMTYDVQRLFYYFDFKFEGKTYNCCFYIDLPYEELNRSEEFESNADSSHQGDYPPERFNCKTEILAIHKKFFIDQCNLPTYTYSSADVQTAC